MAKEEPVKGFKHGRMLSHGQICFQSAIFVEEGWKTEACRQKDHLGSKYKNKGFTNTVIRGDYFLFLTV